MAEECLHDAMGECIQMNMQRIKKRGLEFSLDPMVKNYFLGRQYEGQ